jgi:hypothetical protein
VSLVARHLEENGIPTVIVGSARDIVEHCGVPRFLFTDFPLGNPCGKPYDRRMQECTLGMALDLLNSAWMPRTTVQSPFTWSEDATWREGYAKIDPEDMERLLRAGEERRKIQQRAKGRGLARSD